MRGVGEELAQRRLRAVDFERHGVEGGGQSRDLVAAAHLDLLVVVAVGHLLGGPRDLVAAGLEIEREKMKAIATEMTSAMPPGDADAWEDVLPGGGDVRLRHGDDGAVAAEDVRARAAAA